MRKSLILPVFIIIVLGYHLIIFTFLSVRSRLKKYKHFPFAPRLTIRYRYKGSLRDRPCIPAVVFTNLERKTVPVEEPNYHLSIEPVRCPDKTKEKFILFYTPIAANATRVRNRATTTRSLS